MISNKTRPVLVFDVNETLLDIDALEPVFDNIFDQPRRMREWFAQLVLYSQSLSLSGIYTPFDKLGGGVLRMLGTIHGVSVTDGDVDRLGEAIAQLPVHRDIGPALERLADAGFRMVTLTNSPGSSDRDPLADAGLARFFEHRFTIDPVERFKPSPAAYAQVTDRLDVSPDHCMLVAAHLWDTIGAQAMGWNAALVTRGVNAAIPIDSVPQPTLVVTDMTGLSDHLTERSRGY